MPEVHGGLQARVRREERRFGYGERCRTRFRARADGCAATNPWIELPGHHQDRHPDRRAGSLCDFGASLEMIGFSLVTLILRYRTARRQLTNARDIECGAIGVGFGTAQRRNRLLDDRALSLELAGEVAKYTKRGTRIAPERGSGQDRRRRRPCGCTETRTPARPLDAANRVAYACRATRSIGVLHA